MFRQRHINAGPRGRIAHRAVAAADAARRPLERVAWPLEKVAWAFEQRIVWPLQERTAGRGPSPAIAGAGALAFVAALAVVAGLLLSSGHGGAETERLTTPTRVALAPPPAKSSTKDSGPALHGVAPSFGIGKAVGVAKQDGSGGTSDTHGGASEQPSEEPATEAADAAAGEGAAAATASSAKPVPAGPAAMKVARRFSEAFVFYEIGKQPAHVKAVFDATATPRLTKALEKRPPRLPERAAVPKAEVVNLVPGPRRGDEYTVSVSLLRVGVTSELRVTLSDEKEAGWKVSEILG